MDEFGSLDKYINSPCSMYNIKNNGSNCLELIDNFKNREHFKIKGNAETNERLGTPIPELILMMRELVALSKNVYLYEEILLNFDNLRSYKIKQIIDGPENLYSKGYRYIIQPALTGSSNQHGKHWVIIFIDMSNPTWTLEFYNSCNIKHNHYSELLNNLKINHKKKIIINTTKQQKQKWSCGSHICYYTFKRLEGILPSEYIKLETENEAEKLRESLIKKSIKIYTHYDYILDEK